MGYAYDGAKRLLAEAIDRPGQAVRVTTYAYDAVGNRLSQIQADTLTTYEVDANDRLIRETTGGVGTLRTYDGNGNTTGQAKPGQLLSFGYDQANRRIRTATAKGVIETGYDADGIRNRETADGHTRTWLIDANRDYAQTLEAYTDQRLSTVWVYGDELLAQGTVVAGGLQERSLHGDGLGSVRQASDAAGTVTDRFEYDAFGNELARTGTTDIDHRYRGEQIDPNTGFYNLRARWYDPSNGRFISMDGFAGNNSDPVSLHKYLYANADPVNNWDSSGYFTMGDVGVSLTVLGTLTSVASAGYNLYQGDYVGAATDVGLGFLGAGAMSIKTIQFMSRAGAPIRKIYRAFVFESLPVHVDRLRRLGYTPEQIARALVAERNAIKEQTRALMAADGAIGRALVKLAEARNYLKYGNKVGPTAEKLLEDKGTWDAVIESTQRSSERVNAFIDLITL